jgi:putative Holliday junction resolvase
VASFDIPRDDRPGNRRREAPRLVGLDVGSRRVGIAVSDESGIIASPVGFVSRGVRERTELQAVFDRWQPAALVVGLPTTLSGREGSQAAEVRDFASQVLAGFGLPLHFWDERLTTTIAERALTARGAPRDRRRQEVDAMAAAIILQDFLDAGRIRAERQAASGRSREAGKSDLDV